MASVLKEVAARYAAMVEVAAIEAVTFAVSEAVTFAVLKTSTVFAFGAVVQLAVIALREAATICAVVFVRVHGWRAVVNVSGRAAISHTRSARAALGTKAGAWSTAAAEASTNATARCSSKAPTTAAAMTATTAATAVMLSVRACRENKGYRSCEYKFFHCVPLCVVSGELSRYR